MYGKLTVKRYALLEYIPDLGIAKKDNWNVIHLA